MMMTVKSSFVGEESFNRFGSRMIIVEYNKSNDIIVEFDNGFRANTNYYDFKRGFLKNPYDKSVCGVGYFGEGEYKSKIDGVETKDYRTWASMIKRCYNDNNNVYKDCTVIEEWHNFQNFAKWYHENYYEVENFRTDLDKDILVKGNNVYSPNTCVFVPQNINLLFINNTKLNNKNNLPWGVSFDKSRNKYMAKCNDEKGKQRNLGRFDTVDEASSKYKEHKEIVIKSFAEQYKDRIPSKLYDALISYEV